MATRHVQSRQHGFSLVEIMVGVVIGMIAVLVIYQVFATSEGIKRNITAAGDAQQNGLLSSFMMGIELANAGNGLAVAGQDLGTCTPPAISATPTLTEVTDSFSNSFRPIPLLIFDGGGDNKPDSFFIYYSVAPTFVSAAPIQNVPDVTTYWVQSANGFKTGDAIVAISNPSAIFPANAQCYSSVVTNVQAGPGPVGPTPPADANGLVTITHSPVAAVAGLSLFNLGQANRIQKVRYDLSLATCGPPSPPCNLRSQSLLDPATGAPDNAQPVNPLASNLVNMKLQYGIDTVGDGLIHHWVPAIAGTAYGDWDAATVLKASYSTINSIKAARIAIAVISEQPDKDPSRAGKGLDNYLVFQDCADGGTCYGLTLNQPAVAGVPYSWRYRVYEAVIPLRNEVWNKQ